jgi:hypothetical protein
MSVCEKDLGILSHVEKSKYGMLMISLNVQKLASVLILNWYSSVCA